MSDGGTTLSVVVCGAEPWRHAEIVTAVGAETPEVRTVNVVRVSPTGTMIIPVDGWTLATAGLLLLMLTIIPPAAFPLT
jgi:hypothetical protein